METPKTAAGILFETKGTLYKYTHYNHISFVIDVEKEWKNIVIELEYSPLFCNEHDPELDGLMKKALAEQIYKTEPEYVNQVLKKVIPIKNEISIAVKDPQMWRGEHHFYQNEEPGGDIVTLGEKSSFGFFNSRNPIGLYEIVLHVFAIHTDECQYHLRILGEE